MRPRNQRGAGRIGVYSKLPARETLSVLGGFRQADGAGIQFVIEADRSAAACGYSYRLWVGAGAVVQSVDCAVRMPQLFDIVGSCRQVCNGYLSAGVGGMGSRYKAGTGAVAVNTKLPAGQVLSVLGGLCQADAPHLRHGFQFEIGLEGAGGCTAKGYGSLIAGTAHVPKAIGGVGCGWYSTGRGINRRLRNRPSLCDGKHIAALAEAGPVPIGEAEIGQHTIGVCHRSSCAVQSDGWRTTAG